INVEVRVTTVRSIVACCLDSCYRLRGHSGMALHSVADERHLPEIVAGAPADAELVERARRVRAILDRGGEDDLRPRLHDRVDVHARVRECREETRSRHAVDAVHGLLAL